MNEEVYAVALRNALVEIKNVCPDIHQAFILMDNGTIVAGDEQAVDPGVKRAINSLQNLTEKARSVGGLDDLLIEGDKGKVYVTQVNGMYSIMALSKNADLPFLRTVTGIILPTILKVLHSIGSETPLPTPLKPAQVVTPSKFQPAPLKPAVEEEAVKETVKEQVEAEEIEAPKPLETHESEADIESPRSLTHLPFEQLIVDKFGGLMVRSDTVQLDFEILEHWGSLLGEKEIREVDIETFSGKTSRFKVKVISDKKFEGKGLIRIPEKACETLEVKRGELVRVKPIVPEE